MNTTDTLIRAHLNAAASLVQQALADAKADDPTGLAELRQAIKAGAMLTLHSTFAPASGLARLAIEVIEPNGTAHQLMACDLQREVTQ